MKILFKTLEYQNFRSVGNTPIKIVLNSHKTTLISGLNGSGKSTVISALCFGLFGKGYGSVLKPALVNSINQKQLLVTIEFSIGKKEYKIIRGIKPAIFEIYENGKLKNQDPTIKDYQKILEQQILKFNYRSFTQVVAVGGGSDYVPFMRLSAKDRREFVEDLLDIRVFSTMNTLVKEQAKNLKDELKDLIITSKAQKEKIILQESFIKKLASEKAINADKIRTQINVMEGVNADYTLTLQSTVDKLNIQEKSVNSLNELDDELSDARILLKNIDSKLKDKNLDFERHMSMFVCSTCSQPLSAKHKEDVKNEIEKEISELRASWTIAASNIEQLKSKIKNYDGVIETYASTSKMVTDIKQSMFANNTLLKNAYEQLKDSQADTGSIEEETLKLKTFAKEFISMDNDKKVLLDTQQYQDFIQQVLSDSGIKSKVVRQYIPTINRLVNKYLSDLDFFCNFNLDEYFNETIKSRHRDTFTYEHFSEGQKRRIDLAIILTWADIAKAKNALHTNICFFDEIDAPLDASGSDMLHAMLKTSSSENIFLISHKGDLLSDKVDNTIHFRIKNNFTEVVDI